MNRGLPVLNQDFWFIKQQSKCDSSFSEITHVFVTIVNLHTYSKQQDRPHEREGLGTRLKKIPKEEGRVIFVTT